MWIEPYKGKSKQSATSTIFFQKKEESSLLAVNQQKAFGKDLNQAMKASRHSGVFQNL